MSSNKRAHLSWEHHKQIIITIILFRLTAVLFSRYLFLHLNKQSELFIHMVVLYTFSSLAFTTKSSALFIYTIIIITINDSHFSVPYIYIQIIS